MSELERIAARRSELNALAEELGKRLREVEAEREELVMTSETGTQEGELPSDASSWSSPSGAWQIAAEARKEVYFQDGGRRPGRPWVPSGCRQRLHREAEALGRSWQISPVGVVMPIPSGERVKPSPA